MTVVGSAMVEVRGDTSRFGSDVERGVQGASSGISGALGKVGTIAGGVLAANIVQTGLRAAKDFIGSSIGGASELGETVSKVGVVFGASAREVLKFGDTAARSLGQSENQALAAAGTFGNLFRAIGLTEQTSAGMSVELVKLAGDLASFNNVDPATALDALRAGLVGEAEPLKKFGVNLNEATIKAKALQLGLVSAAGDTDKIKLAQERAAIAQVKLTEAQKKHGENSVQARQAAVTLASANQTLADRTEGTVPALTAAQKAQASYAIILEQTALAQGDFERTSGGLANQQRILKAQTDDLKASLGAALLPTVTSLTSAFNTLLPAIAPILPVLIPVAGVIGGIVAATKVWTAVQTAFNIVLSANPIGLIVLGIAALIAIIVIVATKTQFFQTIFGALVGTFKAVAGVIKTVIGFLVDLGSKILGAVGNFAKLLFSAGVNLVQGLINGLKSMAKKLISALIGLLPAPIRKFANLIGLASPSTLFFTFGVNIVEGLILGVRSQQGALEREIGRLADRLLLPARVPVFAGAGAATSPRGTTPAPSPTVAAGEGGSLLTQNITVNEVAQDPVATARTIAFELGRRGTR